MVKEYKYFYEIILKQDSDTFLNINLICRTVAEKIKTITNFVLGYMVWK